MILPPGFDYAWSAPGRPQALSQWLAAGVRIPASPANLHLGLPLQLVLPAGAQGPAFLVTRNFRAILRYNNALAYALAVGHLADRIAGGAPLAAAWPAGDKPLARAEREELQRLLAARGHDTGGFDGIMGDQTRAAIRSTQRTLNLAEDGHPELRAAAAAARRCCCPNRLILHLLLRWAGNCRMLPASTRRRSDTEWRDAQLVQQRLVQDRCKEYEPAVLAQACPGDSHLRHWHSHWHTSREVAVKRMRAPGSALAVVRALALTLVWALSCAMALPAAAQEEGRHQLHQSVSRRATSTSCRPMATPSPRACCPA